MTSTADFGATEILRLPPEDFLEAAAAAIITQHRALLPDLSSLTVLIPPRAAPALRVALAQAAHLRTPDAPINTLVLPEITTLADCVQPYAAAHALRATSVSERVLEIFPLLKRREWVAAGDTWALCRELVGLADELTHNLTALPLSLDEHSRILARAYAIGKQNADFNFEARLTWDIWQALATPGEGAVDAASSFGLALAAAARSWTRPLCVFGLDDWRVREQHFLAAVAERVPVLLLEADLALSSQPRGRSVRRAFVGAPGAASVAGTPSEAAGLVGVACCAARDIEDQAETALAQLHAWLIAGKRNIAVLALDRVAARRLRALAERVGILMADEVGWPLSTTVAASAVMRWLEARRDGFYHRTLIDLLRSPFIFRDPASPPRERVKVAVLLIEHAIGRVGVTSGLARVRDAVLATTEGGHPARGDALTLLDRLSAADNTFPRSRRSTETWLQALQQSLHDLGLVAGLEADAAGVVLLATLDQACRELAQNTVTLSAREWLDWLRQRLEDARFRDTSITSPVLVTTLEATRYRTFDAALIIGASATHLPGRPARSGVFNQSVRGALGLPVFADALTRTTADLAVLLAATPEVWMSWRTQSSASAEAERPAPWVAALELEARRCGVDLAAKSRLPRVLTGAEVPADADQLPDLAARPAPAVPSEAVPMRISASTVQSLIDCPYQFFSRAVLRLRPRDEVSEEMEKRDFGELVHEILFRFHRSVACVGALTPEAAEAALRAETAAVFAAALEQNWMAHAWRLSWEASIPSYLDWQRAREQAGWLWAEGEAASAVEWTLADGCQLRLEGRLDRVDFQTGEDGAQAAVLDYKTRREDALRRGLSSAGEDVQLPLYLALAEARLPTRSVEEAAYLAISRDGVKTVDLPDAAMRRDEEFTRLSALYQRVRQSAPLPANGVESVCRYCEARGLCRRDWWLGRDETGATDV